MNGYTELPTNMENSRNCLRRIARHDDQEFSNQSILNAMDKFVRNVNAMDETILVPCRLMDRKVGDATDTVPAAPKAQHHGAHHGKKSNRASIREILNTSELFELYNMLKLVKVDLLWGRQDAEDSVEESVVMGCATKSSTSSKGNSNNTDTTGTNNSTANSTNSSSNTATDVTTNSNSTGSSTIVSGSEKVDANNSPATMTSAKGHNRRPSTVSVASSNSASTLSDSDSETSAENDSGIESEGNQEQDRSAELAKQFRTHLIGLYRSLEQMSEAANYLTARYQSDVGPV
ncbi:variant surface antigen A [Anopheles funestus]|uniref:variant surface antigen A n=1 Tax=Anopheles funestus TaxID=62324 RepID=UPI0020C67D4C|nr:variant surface antigen A [Anopheles funestus]